jgi:hypothetical protein
MRSRNRRGYPVLADELRRLAARAALLRQRLLASRRVPLPGPAPLKFRTGFVALLPGRMPRMFPGADATVKRPGVI